MPEIILRPRTAGFHTACNSEPVGRLNYLCVNTYPHSQEPFSYLYFENGNALSTFECGDIPLNLLINILYYQITVRAAAENALQPCTVEIILMPTGAGFFASPAFALTTSWVDYSHVWTYNPTSALFWDILFPNFLNINSGIRLTSGGAGCEARCSHVFATLYFDHIGEIVTNSSPFLMDDIHIDHAFSVLALEDYGRPLYTCDTLRINYQSPSGATGFFNAAIVDDCYLLATVPAASNNSLGKWRFQLFASSSAGLSETYQGKPFFVNVVPQWT